MTKLQDRRQELTAKQAALKALYDEAGGSTNLDLDKITSIKGDSAAKLGELRRLNEELDALGTEVRQLNELVEQAKAMEVESAKAEDVKRKAGAGQPDTQPSRDSIVKSLGMHVVGSDGFKSLASDRRAMKWEIKEYDPRILKAVFQRSGVTDSGYVPESIRSGTVIDFSFQEPEVIDVVPGGTIDQAVYKYMQMSTRMNAAAERTEGTVLAESQYEWEQVSQNVESIGHILPVTEEQLEDVSGMESLLDNTMRVDLRRRVSSQLLSGNGTAPNIRGLLTAVTQTQARGADSPVDAIYKGMTQVRVNAFDVPNATIIHANDWQKIRLLKDTTGGAYLFGNPDAAGLTSLWGLLRVVTTEIAEGTALVGDFARCTFLTRRGLVVETGLNTDDFSKLKISIRCHVRGVMVVFKIAAFTEVTGL